MASITKLIEVKSITKTHMMVNTNSSEKPELMNCQNPNSTNNSIELNLRLDYILTERSTPPTTTQTLPVVVVNCPAHYYEVARLGTGY